VTGKEKQKVEVEEEVEAAESTQSGGIPLPVYVVAGAAVLGLAYRLVKSRRSRPLSHSKVV